jgi:dTDP-4-amino-4,6-dideoxygalactose transaminase
LRFPIYGDGQETKDKVCEKYDYLGISKMYPDSINNISEIKNKFKDVECKCAEKIAKTLMTIPTHIYIGEKDKLNVSEVIKSFNSNFHYFK